MATILTVIIGVVAALSHALMPGALTPSMEQRVVERIPQVEPVPAAVEHALPTPLESLARTLGEPGGRHVKLE